MWSSAGVKDNKAYSHFSSNKTWLSSKGKKEEGRKSEEEERKKEEKERKERKQKLKNLSILIRLIHLAMANNMNQF